MPALSFDKYEVIQPLGQGGQAEVYLARDPMLDRRVAVKVMRPHLSSDAADVERFRREARLIASLRHPQIVQLYEFDVADGQLYMVMEFLDGGTLKDRLAEARAGGDLMPLGTVAAILDRVAGAFDYAHGQGVVHRDIKPTNILFTRGGDPVVTDFGIAKILSAATQLSATNVVVGTPFYMSPEQAQATAVDARSDIYSLGVVLYEMVTGRVPFQGETATAVMMQHLVDPPPPPRSLNPNLPQAVQDVVLKALAKDRSARFDSAGALATAFRAALAGRSPQNAQESLDAATLAETRPPDGESAAQTPRATSTAPQQTPASPPSGKATPPANRAHWYGRVATVVGLVAPLVGYNTLPDEAPQDRRSRIATTLTAAGILFAALQFVLQLFDLVSRPLAGLLSILPYLIAPLFLAGAVLLAVAGVRASTRLNRRRAWGGFVGVVLIGVLWGGWAFYDRIRPPAGYVVAVGDFDGTAASRKVDFGRRIYDRLDQELAPLSSTVQVVRLNQVYSDAAAARAAGLAAKATLVIWGWYDDAGVSPHVEALQAPDLAGPAIEMTSLLNAVAGAAVPSSAAGSVSLRDITRFVRVPASMPDFDLFVKDGPDQITYLTTAILGYVFYHNGDADKALSLFDQALASSQVAGETTQGLDAVYFYRAAVLYEKQQVTQAIEDLDAALALNPGLAEAHHNLAIAYSEQCTPVWQIKPALAEAEAAVRLQPADVSHLRLLGDLYRQDGRYAEAVTTLQKATGLDPGDALAAGLLASAARAAGQTALATDAQNKALALREAAAADPKQDRLTTQLALGDAYVEAAAYDKARAAYEDAQQLAPQDTRVLNGLGNAYYWLGQLDKAADAYRAWATAAPQDPTPQLLLGLLLDEQGQPDQAISALKQVVSLSACHETAQIVLGQIYFNRQDYASAAGAYAAVTAIDPDNADAWYLQGSMHLQQDRLEPAAAALQSAVRLKPDAVSAVYALGSVYLRLGRAADAAAQWEHAVQLAPDDAANLLALANAYEKLARWDDAAPAYEKALALKDDADTHLYLGLVREQQKQLPAAVAEFEKAVALNPQDDLAYAALGDAYVQVGRNDDALAALSKALALKDDNQTRNQLAALYASQGKTDDAIAAYQASVQKDAQDTVALVGLGDLYAQSGRVDDAAAAYRQAIALAPATVRAQAGLAGVAYKRCNLAAAVQAARDAANLAPGVSFYQGLLAAMLEAQGSNQEAATHYASLQAAAPTDLYAHLVAGDYLYRRGELDAALSQLHTGLQTPNPSPILASIVHDELGQVYMVADHLPDAAAAFQASVAVWADNADAQAGLGDVALREGRFQDALAAYAAAEARLPAYGVQASTDNASLLGATIAARRGLVLARQGMADQAQTAFDAAATQAARIVQRAPQWPRAHFAQGYAFLARGAAVEATAAFAEAEKCDQSLASLAARVEKELGKVSE